MQLEQRQASFGAIEAILFVAGEAVLLEDLARALEMTVLELDSVIAQMQQQYRNERRGIDLVRLADKVQLRTSQLYAAQVQCALKPLGERTLSRSVLETLSIIAYKQPITRSEVEALKGVSADYSIRALIERGLIEPVGRKQTLGRPIQYGTTDEFMRHFGISSLAQLPPLADAEEEDAITI